MSENNNHLIIEEKNEYPCHNCPVSRSDMINAGCEGFAKPNVCGMLLTDCFDSYDVDDFEDVGFEKPFLNMDLNEVPLEIKRWIVANILSNLWPDD